MLIPYNTDAPLYHRPIGTVTLIAANFGFFVETSLGTGADGWLLQFGDGLHPLQWVSSAFFHFHPGHLIGNMIFLWIFGLLIEGKLGTLRFLSLYFGLCLLTGAVTQTAMLFSAEGGGAGGASSVLFAMMAICLIWAPENNFQAIWGCWYGWCRRGGEIELSVKFLAFVYLASNLFDAWWTGFAMSSEMLHLTGAVIGVPIGILYLKRNWVDCEGWDLLSLWKRDLLHPGVGSFWGWEGKPFEQAEQVAVADRAGIRSRQWERLRQRMEQAQWGLAVDLYIDLRRTESGPAPVSRQQLTQLVNEARTAERWAEAAWLLEHEYLLEERTRDVPATLMLAGILVQGLDRPRAALQALHRIEDLELKIPERRQMERIQIAARRLIAGGLLEVPRTRADGPVTPSSESVTSPMDVRSEGERRASVPESK